MDAPFGNNPELIGPVIVVLSGLIVSLISLVFGGIDE